MSQISQVTRIALCRCSQCIFHCNFLCLCLCICSLNVFLIVFVFVFVFFIVFLLVRSCLLITLIKCLKSHKSLGSLFEGALNVFVFVIVFVFVFVIVIVKSPHLFNQMSQRSQVSRIALWRCSLNVFVFVIVFVFVFVIVVSLVRSCRLITLIKCVKGHKSLGSLLEGAL